MTGDDDDTTNQTFGLAKLPGEDNSLYGRTSEELQALQRVRQLQEAKRISQRNARIGNNDPNRFP